MKSIVTPDGVDITAEVESMTDFDFGVPGIADDGNVEQNAENVPDRRLGKTGSKVTMYTKAQDARQKHLDALSTLISSTVTTLMKLGGVISDTNGQTAWKTCLGNLLKANKELAKVEMILELE